MSPRKEAFHGLLEEWFSEHITKRSLHFDVIIMLLIFLNTVVFIFETTISDPLYISILKSIDLAILFIFSVELILRFYMTKNKGTFFLSGYSWIDILAVVPFWFGVGNFQTLRLFRIFRVFRFFRFMSYSQDYLASEFKEHDWSLEKLFAFRLLFTIFMFMFVAATLIFHFESNVNSSISTFWDALYFVIIAATTVGFGDITPVTEAGRLIIILAVLSSILIIPVQLTSMVKYFTKQDQKMYVRCKDCDHRHHDHDAHHCKNCGKRL